MTDRPMPPAYNGTEMRLDVLIQRVETLIDLLTPAALEPIGEPGTIELREPETAPKPKRAKP